MVITDTIKAKSSSLSNAEALLNEIDWFTKIAEARINLYTGQPCEVSDIYELTPPDLSTHDSVYAEFARFYQLGSRERLVLILSLLPHIAPHLLGNIFKNAAKDIDLTAETCFTKSSSTTATLPSAETALFLLAGNDLLNRFDCIQLFGAEHVFKEHNILSLASVSNHDPYLYGQLLLNEEYIDLFTTGKVRKPLFSMEFPARKIVAAMEWEDLVLDNYTRQQLNEIKIWLQHGHHLHNGWGLSKRIKPGYKALFYGPPGTGKTLTAGLLGKLANLDVYRVDLSMVVSKYIGETEKNLEKVFAKAEDKNWILFFDEADALFGKRTSISDAHDKYANQEIAYLLQRLEDYNGLVILSSNMRNNVDEAFGRRLQSIIHFPMPRHKERLQLWQNSFSTKTVFSEDINLDLIAEKFELAGGSIINVVQHASLMALDRGDTTIRKNDLWEGIRKEYIKDGRSV
ncbi:MAG: ATP-binding protein [Bacteroidetes bacterium]|nr:MAG: ATP-binding protein [Bacteroidota bacterium]